MSWARWPLTAAEWAEVEGETAPATAPRPIREGEREARGEADRAEGERQAEAAGGDRPATP